MSNRNLSIFLPIYNESDVITEVVTSAVDYLDLNTDDYELLLVNDGSTDDTLSKLNSLQTKHSKVKVLDHEVNKGYGAAIKTGVENAKFDWVFFMDSDGQFNISSLDPFFEHMPNADLVIGYREVRNDNPHRLFLANTYKALIKSLFGLSVTDIDCAFKLMRREKIQDLNLMSSSFFISTELLCKASKKGHTIVELPVTHLPRTVGTSSVTMKRSLESLVELFKLYNSIKYI